MSRPIKFRAWRGDFMDHGEFYLNEDGVFYEAATNTHDTPHREIERPDDEPVLMQYTGLKDKNGVEIYEGDTIRLKESEYDRWRYGGVIEWWNDRWVIYSHGKSDLREYKGMRFTNKRVEVIGNIYEHKHLLEDQDRG